MTVLLVLFTLILFLTADYLVQRARERRQVPALEEGLVPAGIRIASNHSWIRDDEHGVSTIGLDALVGTIVGAVESIVLPKTGSQVSPEQPAVVLRDGSRELRVALPVRGRVVAVNPRVIRHPGVVERDPYHAGWLVQIRPDRSRPSGDTFRSGSDAVRWLSEQAAAAREFLFAHAPQPALATMYDGGEPAAAALKSLDDDAWREFEQSFLNLASRH